MARKSKWIQGFSPNDPIEKVARAALEARLSLVWHYLPRAADGDSKHTENVHQLRVATRRAMATLRMFQSLLPARRALWLEEKLKKVRQAAGKARDFDVLAGRLRKMAGPNAVDDASSDGKKSDVQQSNGQHAEKASPGPWSVLLKSIEQRRRDVQPPIEKIYKKLHRKDFFERQAGLVKRVRLRGKADQLSKPSYACTARKAMRPLVEDLFMAAKTELHDFEALHAFRIQSKQLRYAMEIFAGAFGPDFRKRLYPLVEALQEKLGRINDHASASEHLDEWLKAADDKAADDKAESDALEWLIEHERQAMNESRQDFLTWWTDERRQELESGFGDLLSRQDLSNACEAPIQKMDDRRATSAASRADQSP